MTWHSQVFPDRGLEPHPRGSRPRPHWSGYVATQNLTWPEVRMVFYGSRATSKAQCCNQRVSASPGYCAPSGPLSPGIDGPRRRSRSHLQDPRSIAEVVDSSLYGDWRRWWCNPGDEPGHDSIWWALALRWAGCSWNLQWWPPRSHLDIAKVSTPYSGYRHTLPPIQTNHVDLWEWPRLGLGLRLVL